MWRTRDDLLARGGLTGDLAAEDGVVVPEYEQLCVLGDVAAQQHHRKGQQPSVSWYSSDTITGS